MAKWYIKIPCASFHNFNSLATTFLTHFELLIRYDTSTKLLASLKKSKSIHISDHIHEWICRLQLAKVFVPDQILAEWFTKSLLPVITEEVAKGGVIMEE